MFTDKLSGSIEFETVNKYSSIVLIQHCLSARNLFETMEEVKLIQEAEKNFFNDRIYSSQVRKRKQVRLQGIRNQCILRMNHMVIGGNSLDVTLINQPNHRLSPSVAATLSNNNELKQLLKVKAEKLAKLHIIDARGAIITQRDLQALKRILTRAKNLQTVSIYFIKQIFIKKILYGLMHTEKLEGLELKRSNLSGRLGGILSAIGKNTLTTLDLRMNEIDHEAVPRLANGSNWNSLRSLVLTNNNIGCLGAASLSKNVTWSSIRIIHLTNNNIGDAGAKSLAENVSWVFLNELHLPLNNIQDEGACALACNAAWKNLTRLNLAINMIGVAGAQGLSQNSSWIKLQVLKLQENHVGPEGAAYLFQNKAWSNLDHIDLSRNGVRDEGAVKISECCCYKKICSIYLLSNKISAIGENALKTLREKLPNIKVLY